MPSNRILLCLGLTLTSVGALAQTPATPAGDPLAPLSFLLGTWSAKTDAPGTSGGSATGSYTFHLDLGGHAIERTTSADSCKGPAGFDCAHHDRLTLFSDPNALAAHHASLLAFYMDSEGHVIYYTVSLPDTHTAVFNSQGTPNAPKFRLVYHLEGEGAKAIMTGKFQMAAPGSDEYHSYLEWSGTRQ
jgi:hypothetical protein